VCCPPPPLVFPPAVVWGLGPPSGSLTRVRIAFMGPHAVPSGGSAPDDTGPCRAARVARRAAVLDRARRRTRNMPYNRAGGGVLGRVAATSGNAPALGNFVDKVVLMCSRGVVVRGL